MTRMAAPSRPARQADDDQDEIDRNPIVHRRTTVAQAGVHKPAGAVASVFEMGAPSPAPGPAADPKPAPARRKRGPGTPIDLENLQIEIGVPLPSKNPNGTAVQQAYELLLQRLLPGQSVVISSAQARGLRAAALRRRVRVVVRELGNGRARCWMQGPIKTKGEGA